VTGTEWLFRYLQNKRNNGRKNGDCLAARWFSQGKTVELFVTGEDYSLDKEPLMGVPYGFAEVIWRKSNVEKSDARNF
jgi:hypothetical protein